MRRRILVLLSPLAVLALATGVWAFWTALGSGNASATQQTRILAIVFTRKGDPVTIPAKDPN